MKYIAMGDMVWGRGDTAEKAVKNMLFERKVKSYVVYSVDGDDRPEVDCMGRLCSLPSAKVKLVAQKGVKKCHTAST